MRAGNGDFSGYHEDDAHLLSWEIKEKDRYPPLEQLGTQFPALLLHVPACQLKCVHC